jgi:hypothetical protein
MHDDGSLQNMSGSNLSLRRNCIMHTVYSWLESDVPDAVYFAASSSIHSLPWTPNSLVPGVHVYLHARCVSAATCIFHANTLWSLWRQDRLRRPNFEFLVRCLLQGPAMDCGSCASSGVLSVCSVATCGPHGGGTAITKGKSVRTKLTVTGAGARSKPFNRQLWQLH